MSESFTLDILYKGINQEITCTLRVSAYTYQFLCSTGSSQIVLEKDNDGNLRAMEADPFTANINKPDPGLVRALIEEMESILHDKT